MLSYTLEEQNETIHEFLHIIEAIDVTREMENRCKNCDCNFDSVDIAFNALPENLIEQIKGLTMIFVFIDVMSLRCIYSFNLEDPERRINTLDLVFFFMLWNNSKQ